MLRTQRAGPGSILPLVCHVWWKLLESGFWKLGTQDVLPLVTHWIHIPALTELLSTRQDSHCLTEPRP